MNWLIAVPSDKKYLRFIKIIRNHHQKCINIYNNKWSSTSGNTLCYIIVCEGAYLCQLCKLNQYSYQSGNTSGSPYWCFVYVREFKDHSCYLQVIWYYLYSLTQTTAEFKPRPEEWDRLKILPAVLYTEWTIFKLSHMCQLMSHMFQLMPKWILWESIKIVPVSRICLSN